MDLFDKDKSKLQAFLQDQPKKKEKKGAGGTQREGLDFETAIEASCFVYQHLKIACIERRQPKAFLGKTKDNKYFVGYAKKAGSDFVGGVLKPEKNTIYIETKSTVKGEIPLWQEDSGIKRHQLEIMQWLESCGFIAIFLWEVRNDKKVYKFTPSQLIDGVGGAKKLTSMDCEELKFTRVMKVKNGLHDYWDFLELL